VGHDGKVVCAGCFREIELSSYVEQNGELGDCDYCERTDVTVLEMENVVAHIKERLRTEYSTAEEEGLLWDDEEQRYFPESFDIHEVFDREFGGPPANDSELQRDLFHAFSDETWCQKDGAILTRREGLSSGWRNFCHNIKHDTRYLFFKGEERPEDGDREYVPPAEMLSELGALVQRFDLTRVVKPGSTFYRVRWDPRGATYTSPADLGPPPEEYAGQSRMSAAGIPMMYLATDEGTALAETRSSPEGAASIATFRIIEELRVLEVVKIPDVPSILEAGSEDVRDNLKFLHEFREDISRPIETDGSIHYEYAPTQVVTEYFRRAFATRDGKPLDGIVFPSSRGTGDNLVLFLDRGNVAGVDDDFLSKQGRKSIELINVEHQLFLPDQGIGPS
jgi:hypothetical protein